MASIFACCSSRGEAKEEDEPVEMLKHRNAGSAVSQQPVSEAPSSSSSQGFAVWCIGSFVCVAGLIAASALQLPTAVAIIAGWSAAQLIFVSTRPAQQPPAKKPPTAVFQGNKKRGAAPGSFAGVYTDRNLPNIRPSPEEAAELRKQGKDPFIGQRLNYLEGTTVPFEPLLAELDASKRAKFLEFEGSFPAASKKYKGVDRTRFYQEPDRFTLLLFLQANEFNVAKSTERLLYTMEWRQTSGFEDFVDNPDMQLWNLYWKCRPRRQVSWDSRGQPLTYEALGQWMGNDNGYKAMPMERWVMCYAFDISLQQNMFRLSSVRHNRPIHRVSYVGDLKGLKLWQAKNMSKVLGECFKLDDVQFPECAGNIVLVNAPSFLPMVFGMIRRMLDPRTQAALSFHSDLAKPFLIESFGKEALPVAFGGTLDVDLPIVKSLDEIYAELGMQGPLQA